MTKDFEQEAKVFKAFCDPNRLKILDILKTGEHNAFHQSFSVILLQREKEE